MLFSTAKHDDLRLTRGERQRDEARLRLGRSKLGINTRMTLRDRSCVSFSLPSVAWTTVSSADPSPYSEVQCPDEVHSLVYYTAYRGALYAIGTSNSDNCDETLVVTLGMIFDDDSTRHNVDSEETVRR